MEKQIMFMRFLAFILSYAALAFGAVPLQDFCVADFKSSVRVNGLACKNPELVKTDDFFFSGLTVLPITSTPYGSRILPVSVAQLPGLNTLGISMARLYFSPRGVNPPHSHPRASETLTVTDGSLLVGFITLNPENRLFTKVLHRGDVFVFPQGLVHFQHNVGTGHNSAAWASFNSENPGTITIGNAVFGSKPSISRELLAKAFQIDEDKVEEIQSKF